MSFGYSVGDIIAVSQLAIKVCLAYRDGPENHRQISEEVEALQFLIDDATRCFENTTLGSDVCKRGQKAMKGCQSVLEELYSLIDKYKDQARTNVINRVKISYEDFAKLRARLTTNALLLTSFIDRCEHLETQAHLNAIHRLNPKASIVSFAESINTRNAYRKLFETLYQNGVTKETIDQRGSEILDMLKPQDTDTSLQVDNDSITEQNEPPAVDPLTLASEENTNTSPTKTRNRAISMLGRGAILPFGSVVPLVSEFIGISELALKVYTAYKDGPVVFSQILNEVKAFQIVINKAVRHFGSTTFSNNNRQEGQEVLKNCQNVLEELSSLINKYSNLASTKTSQTLQRVKFVMDDDIIVPLRARIISNTCLLNSFIQSCEFLELQARLTDICGPHHSNSRVSIDNSTTTRVPTHRSAVGDLFSDRPSMLAKEHRAMSMFELGLKGNPALLATSLLYVAYKDAPNNYRHILDEAKSLQIILYKAMNYFEETDLSQCDRQDGEGVLKSCRDVLDDLNSLVEKYNGLAFPKSGQVFQRVKFGSEDIENLRARVISTTGLLNCFIQSCGFLEIQARLTEIRSLHHAYSKLSTDDSTIEDQTQLLAIGPFMLAAATSGNIQQLVSALKYIQNINFEDDLGETALHKAAGEGHEEIVYLLLEKGAATEATNNLKSTPLHFAIMNCHIGMTELLLRNGASAEARNWFHNTPLHIAAWSGRVTIVEMLLKKGASIDATNQSGDTPLGLATRERRIEIIQLLKDKAAEPIAHENQT